MFIQSMFRIVNFDVFDASGILQTLFILDDIDDYPPYNYYFDNLGYDNCNFLYLIGPPVLSVLVYLGLVFIFLILFKIN